jgi:hypothetical protein
MSELRQALLKNVEYNALNMNDEDRKYLRTLDRMRPSLEVFSRMVKILENEQKQTDQLLLAADTSLLETYESLTA